MNIAYITTDNPNDIHGWSGLTSNIAQSLISAGNHLDYIHSFSANPGLILKLKQKLYPKLTGKFIQPNRYPAVYKQYEPKIHRGLNSLSHTDFIFSNSTETVAALDTDIPIALWLDACFAGMVGYYPEFNRLHSETIHRANELEQLAFNKARYLFFASDWAAKTAIDHYKVSPEKIKVVPFGANIRHNYQADDMRGFVAQKSDDVCNLLFIGVYWERKGGDIALKVAELLNKSGVKTVLTIVGCTPFNDSNKPDFVVQEGFLSKKNVSDSQKLEKLFLESHFLIVPSEAECYGLVYCEANAYGLPAIGTNTGGIPTIIKNGINGQTFDLASPTDDYVAFIKRYSSDKRLYGKLSESSFNEYKYRLNWQVSGKIVSEILQNSIK